MRSGSGEERNAERVRGVGRRRYLFLTVLLSLHALVVGGCIALHLVSRLLNSQLDVYAAAQRMAAASAILDIRDDLLYYYLIYGAVLLILVLITAIVLTWMVTPSRILRYGVILLCLILFLAFAGLGLSRGHDEPGIPPTTPTPPAGSLLLWEEDAL
jgi:hypothetical protein